jgi:hypothetical protein
MQKAFPSEIKSPAFFAELSFVVDSALRRGSDKKATKQQQP